LLSELIKHEHAPLSLAQACSAIEAPAPLFSAHLNYRYAGATETAAGAAEDALRAWKGIEYLKGYERNNYPFSVNVDDLGEGFALSVWAQPPADPDRVCEYLHKALEQLAEALENAPATPIRNLDVLPVSERRQLLVEWNEI
jgi:hypothetical protein